MRASPKRRAIALVATLGTIIGLAPSASAANRAGFTTSQASMLMPVLPGVTTTPIITVGETLPGRYRFEAIPDGISIRTRGQGRADVFVNHETSTVPFPYNPNAPTEANSQNDFDNAQLSRLVVNQFTGGILQASMVIRSRENFQRFCSNYLATAAEGFDRALLFTNEEAVDWVNRSGKAWPATIGADEARQAGVVVAYDARTGARRPIWGMGRHNHENSVAVPGYDELVVISGDDTFTNNPSQSQVFSYIADDADAVWNDEGSLWAFVSDDPNRQRYEDWAPGDPTAVSGHFIPVPEPIASGRNPDGTDMMSADVPSEFGGPYPPPPNDGSWQRDPNGIGIDGPQWVLEKWSQLNGVFRFIRVEDTAYDKRPGMSNVHYIIDSGRGTIGAPAPGRSTNGRVWEMVLDPENPRQVDSLSILVEGDDAPVKTPTEIHQPDNIESTASGLYITEDPGSSQQFPFGSTDANATTARLWRVDLTAVNPDAAKAVVARVDQSADEGPTDVDGTPGVFAPGNLGAWESSGVVDASSVFGPGAFLVTVQAHTLWVDKAPGDDNFPPAGPDFTFKREGGQLVLLRVPVA
jgi:hypothetical protein